MVLLDQRDAIAGADAVVHAVELYLDVAELSACEAVVLGAGVDALDLRVRCVGDQGDLADGERLGEACPVADRVLDRLVACVLEV